MNLKLSLLLLLCAAVNTLICTQTDSLWSKVKLAADFRFRVEQDWDSRKSDGTFREDRTRLRYRLRTGATYENGWYSFGFRIRTGDPKKQQDPQLTLGTAFEEFGTLPLGFEKVFFRGRHRGFDFWLGKYDFSFARNNELFWSDNVFPEGVFVKRTLQLDTSAMATLEISAGHYILSAAGRSLSEDAYVQGVQTSVTLAKRRLSLFPSLYLFRNIPNIPDGEATFALDYTILHLGGKINASKNEKLLIDFDVYRNLEDYSTDNRIASELREEKTGYSLGLQYGRWRGAGDWKVKATYASLQRYSILDYMAQNDWARWDYSANNSPDGRLSNYTGVELVGGYKISNKINLIVKYYVVRQIVPLGLTTETGQRIRFDLDVTI